MSSEQDHLKETDTEARFEFKKEEKSAFKTEKGLTEETIRVISEDKNEPEWMLERRLRALKQFQQMPMPTDWPGQPDLSEVDIDEIVPYIRPDIEVRGGAEKWEDLPDEIRDTFDKLGIPEAERNALSGVGAQYESEIVYQNMQEQWEEKGVVFCDMDKAVQEHEELVREYFMTKCVPPSDNKFAALHGAIWSGGSFVYVPEGVTVEMPIQAYFRMNSEGMGQFEHTLIIAEENSEVHYIEGCSAPKYSHFNLHSGGVEVFVGEGAHVQYSTVQNWSKNTYNLNTKRAIVEGLEGHDAVPVLRAEGTGRDGQPHHHRLCGRGPEHRHRREGVPQRAEHQVDHRVKVHQQGRRPHQLPRARPHRRRRGELEHERRV
jgi:Fe-S cluster assembly protein SufB